MVLRNKLTSLLTRIRGMMKSYMFCVFLILLMVVPLMGISYEQTEEYTQKQAI